MKTAAPSHPPQNLTTTMDQQQHRLQPAAAAATTTPPPLNEVEWWTQTHKHMSQYARPIALQKEAWPKQDSVLIYVKTPADHMINVVTKTGCRMHTEAEFRAACGAHPFSEADNLIRILKTLKTWLIITSNNSEP